MKRSSTIALLGAFVLLPFSSAAAQFRLSGTGVLAAPTAPLEAFSVGNVQFEFLLPQSLNSISESEASILLEGLNGRFSQGGTQVNVLGDLVLYTSFLEGGFSFESPVGFYILDTFGEQLFSGAITDPFLIEGEFALENFPEFPAVLAVRGNVAITAVPEPSSLLLMVAGASLLAVVARRRRA